jgi:hypothetical protein
MGPHYSLVADWLDTFQTSSVGIQALWLVVWPLALVAVVACIMRAVREIAVAALVRHGAGPGRPVYVVYEAPDGRWLVHAGGAVRELEAEDFAQEGRALPGPPA